MTSCLNHTMYPIINGPIWLMCSFYSKKPFYSLADFLWFIWFKNKKKNFSKGGQGRRARILGFLTCTFPLLLLFFFNKFSTIHTRTHTHTHTHILSLFTHTTFPKSLTHTKHNVSHLGAGLPAALVGQHYSWILNYNNK